MKRSTCDRLFVTSRDVDCAVIPPSAVMHQQEADHQMAGAIASEVASQQEVFSFLTDPATHGGRAVQRIDTHAASVFLAGDHAFKVKRAVRYPYLDFSTLAKRKAALEVELEVNRAFAPQIYTGVVPIIRRPDGALAIGGDGAPVEWALRMRRFDETDRKSVG